MRFKPIYYASNSVIKLLEYYDNYVADTCKVPAAQLSCFDLGSNAVLYVGNNFLSTAIGIISDNDVVYPSTTYQTNANSNYFYPPVIFLNGSRTANLSNGNYVCLYLYSDGSGLSFTVYSSNTNIVQTLLISGSSTCAGTFDVAGLTSGGFVVNWGTGSSIMIQFFDNYGGQVTSATTISLCDYQSYSLIMSVQFRNNNGFGVFYQKGSSVYMAHYLDNRSLVTSCKAIITDKYSLTLVVSILPLSNGGFFVIFEDGQVEVKFFSAAGDGSGNYIFLRTGSPTRLSANLLAPDQFIVMYSYDSYSWYGIVYQIIPFSININQITIKQGKVIAITTSQIAVTSNSSPSLITLTVSPITHGQFEFSSNPNTAITSFTYLNFINNLVSFRHDVLQPTHFKEPTDLIQLLWQQQLPFICFHQ